MTEPAPISSTLLVSVMMPAYNAGAYIEQAVHSLQAQTYPHWELLVVDDGSTDDTSARLAAIRDERIRYRHQENAGEAVARNAALDMASGDLLAFLDADDAYLPEHLALAVEFLTANPGLDGVYTDGYHMDPQGQRLAPLSSRRRGPFTGSLFKELVRASDVFGPPLCVVLRLSSVLASGLRFDPQIVIGPDWDFFTRFAEHTRFGYLPQLTCLYRVHPGSISLTTRGERRLQDLRRCREKAMDLPGFASLQAETRLAVFYDLLLELLAGQPARQDALTRDPRFALLPPAGQARLLRLLAVKALSGAAHAAPDAALAGDWLRRARRCNPADWRARLLWMAYSLNPVLLSRVLRLRS